MEDLVREDIKIRDITCMLPEYRDKIKMLFSLLGPEVRFFNLTVDRLMRSKLLLITLFNDEIIGLGGLERKIGITRSIIMIRQKFQRQGIGRLLYMNIIERAKQEHNLILAVIEEDNSPSIGMHLSLGFRMTGKRGKLHYLFCPLNRKGLFIYKCIEVLFPVVNMFDRLTCCYLYLLLNETTRID